MAQNDTVVLYIREPVGHVLLGEIGELVNKT